MQNHKHLHRLCVVVILLFAVSAEIPAQGDAFLQSEGTAEAWFSINWGSTRDYFNVDGQTRLFDSVKTTFTAFTLGLSADYKIIKNLEANVELPIGYYTLTSESRFPDRSIFAPAWFGVGLTYGMPFGRFRTAVSSMVRIPPGFHNGIYDDPNHPTFLSDGYLQFLNILHFGYAGDEFWLKGSIGYNVRTEEPVDEIVYYGQAGISRVEGAGIFVGFGGVLATEDASQPLRPFYAGADGTESEKLRQDGGTGRFTTIDREDYIALQPGGFVQLNQHLTLSAQYQVKLFGVNTFRLNSFSVAAGWKFSSEMREKRVEG
ncbi:MAG: hypothetical protein J4G05_02690 [Chlorobi bacterium]|nr:hypothetical protein [Chlorobiota bacterium]